MGTSQAAAEARGRRLLGAVERLIADDEVVRELADACDARARARRPQAAEDPQARRELASREIVRTFSNRAALAGALSGVPALFPGPGALAAGLTGTLGEVAFLLKTEVEMCLALAHVHGFDLKDRRERQLAFLLAAVGTQEAAGRSGLQDLIKAEEVAIWNYGPRVAGRLIVEGFATLALGSFWRGLVKVVPFLGVAVGSALNKFLTTRVGERALAQLQVRRAQREEEALRGPPARRRTSPARRPRSRKAPQAR
jgi:hypothetical protein